MDNNKQKTIWDNNTLLFFGGIIVSLLSITVVIFTAYLLTLSIETISYWLGNSNIKNGQIGWGVTDARKFGEDKDGNGLNITLFVFSIFYYIGILILKYIISSK